ncbi:MAG TPA: dihydrolipoamide acetyltransferase family protein [Dehalococcoidia bacterium]|nr:dihydrolipoamide acetyltransferase family protein [Dehalococcoidia bacterium]
MATEVTMPQMGADMTEGTVVRWLKQVGDTVTRGELIAEIETDKATVELEAFEEGTLLKHLAPEGETVPVGEVIALLGEESEMAPDIERTVPAPVPAHRPSSPGTSAAVHEAEGHAPARALPSPVPRSVPTPDGDRIRISPVARRIALESGVDVRSLSGTGPDGRILRRDVEQALAGPAADSSTSGSRGASEDEPPSEPEASPDSEVVALTRMRQAIARRMAQSKQQQPHYYLTLDIDMTAALAFREQFNSAASDGQRASINDLVIKACAVALSRHGKFNAEFRETEVLLHRAINIAIGIALEDGLIAPAIIDCGSKTLGQIAESSKGLVERAKDGKLRAEEYGGATFTITNLGAYSVEALIGIINPPQAAILGVGTVLDKAVVRDGSIVARKVMKVVLSADHRVTDGAEGAVFISEIRSTLENPAGLAF